MKKYILLLLASYGLIAGRVSAQTGRNCYNTQFHNDASNYDEVNANLLSYLTTMVYGDYLRYLINPVPAETDASIITLFQHDDQFLAKFKTLLTPFFTPSLSTAVLVNPGSNLNVNPALNTQKLVSAAALPPSEPDVTFQFHSRCNPAGYDPEAILISTPSTIFVVFRGTDRVACNVTPLGYQWAEWMTTDFNFNKRDATFMNGSIQGQVHRGMGESLVYDGFADSLATSIISLLKNKSTGATKKVWITGHSLGGGHAQLFAMILKFKYSITAQGLYLYEAPHPGDATFVNQLNATIGKTHIQRFEFGDDPIPTLAPQIFLFARAGSRNYFKDYNSNRVTTEQIPGVDDLKILCALGNLPGEQIPATAHFAFPPLCPGSVCYHHPTLILQATRHQLNPSVLSSLPPAVPLPTAGDNCNAGDLSKAENNDLINNITTGVENTITAPIVNTANAVATILWQAGNIASNLIGNGLQEGKYKISSYAFINNPKKYLHWNGTVGSQLSVSTSATVFTIAHKFDGGYQLFSGGGNMAPDVKYSFGLPTGAENTNNVLMKTKDGIIGDEETWYFFKLPGSSNMYALYNWNTHNILEVNSTCLSANACDVNEAKGVNDRATQVWVLEPSN